MDELIAQLETLSENEELSNNFRSACVTEIHKLKESAEEEDEEEEVKE